MKRLMPSSLIAWLAANPNCHREDCFVISLPTGLGVLATTGQWDITLLATTPGWASAQTTFSSTTYGIWSRGKIVSEASTKFASNTMDITVVPQPGTLYPGTALGVLNAALNHLFDGATVWVYTAYMPLGQYGTVVGVETKFQGTITKAPMLQRNKCQWDCADPLYMLDMKVPKRLFQSNCGWSFCDSNCSLLAVNYTVNFAAAPTASATLNSSTALTQPTGYFAQGVVRCLTGANAGLSATVKSYSVGGPLVLVQPFILPVSGGDTFAVIKGCDKTPTTCAATKWTNGTPEPEDYRIRFGGTPLVPTPTQSI